MVRSELRRERKRRRAEMRAILARVRRLARDRLARLGRTPAFKAAREAAARRRRRTLATISLLLLALLLLDCEGKSGPGAVLAKATPAAAVKKTPVPKREKPNAFRARVETQKRPGYGLDARPGPDWLDDFRLQVAARSPRLARCFNGSERGGAFRWTVSVDAKTGAVADHELEPLGSGAGLGSAQKACATRALSDPAYDLKDAPATAEALPNRVSLVLEF